MQFLHRQGRCRTALTLSVFLAGCSKTPSGSSLPIMPVRQAIAPGHEEQGPPVGERWLEFARLARAEGRLERALRLFELASKSGAPLEPRELDEARARLNDDGVSAEEWLARARASERTDPVSSREAFDRARLAFEKRIGERAKAELGGELIVTNVGVVGGSARFAVSGTDGYDLWDLTERELIRRFRFDVEERAQLSSDGRWFATPYRLHDAEGRIKLEYEASDFFSQKPAASS
jgi:hypothetical protein